MVFQRNISFKDFVKIPWSKVVKSAVDFSGPTMANQKPKADLIII
jgi:hypothetical protein